MSAHLRQPACHGVVVLVLLLVGGCRFPELPPIDEDASQGDGSSSRHTLTLTVDGAGSGAGSISVEPGGFTCSSATCTRDYDAGAELTITVAGEGAVDGVVSVTGDCTASPCSIVMDADRAVTAQFVRFACAPSTATCTNGMYTECDSTGNFVSHVVPNGMDDGSPLTITMNNYACPMGCHASQPRCADIMLGNGVELALDTAAVSPTGPDVVLPRVGAPAGTIAIHTDNFDSVMGVVHLTDTDGTAVDVPAQVIEQPGEPGAVLVLKARTFTLRSGGVLKVNGGRAFGVATHFDTYVAGTIDASADWTGGPIAAGPGAQPYAATCTGAYSAAAPGATGGGGGACVGGAGSTGASGGAISSVAPPFIAGGCFGGKGPSGIDIPGMPGGGVLLASRRRVYLAPTAIVDLTGAGGTGTNTASRGGGSGGNIVVMSPLARVASAARIYSRGGGGGAASGSSSVYGNDGPATGGAGAGSITCSGCGTGGAGGYEGACTGSPGTGSGSALGSGGGSAGTCAFYSLSGAADASVLATKCVRASNTLQPRSP